MASTARKAPSQLPSASNDSNRSTSSDDINDVIKNRQSKELVIGLCGPIGSGLSGISDQIQRQLETEGYEVFVIRISDKILELSSQTVNGHLNRADRYEALMDIGNDIREQFKDEVCANLAAEAIARHRDHDAEKAKNEVRKERALTESESSDQYYNKQVALRKRAYIVNQLKHPKEVKALQSLYKGMFYLVGILCDENRRHISLTSEGIDSKKALDLIIRDKKENIESGQQLEETMLNADLFINNSDPNSSSTAALFERFLKLIHGQHGITPTKQEIGMYAAYTTSMQSACLSRQVGAAIYDKQGNVLSLGRNDVPKFGGGLYSEDDHFTPHSKDYRCLHRDQRCHNVMHKQILKGKISEELNFKSKENATEIMDLIPELADDSKREALNKAIEHALLENNAADNIYKNTPIKNLTEYSRAIHAEMDALMSLTRSNRLIESGAVLYTTTYPCHNCARHIIAAGIEEIIFIEPYEKSLAIKLHDDALSHSSNTNKVHLRPFQGVSPRKYQLFFSNTSPRKGSDGKIIISDNNNRSQLNKEPVDSYLDRELKISEFLEKKRAEVSSIITTSEG